MVMSACQGDDRSGFRVRVERVVRAAPADVSVYYRRLSDGDSLLIAPDVRMHAASTMKLPVMMRVFRDAEAGRFDLDSALVVSTRFRSIADGSSYDIDSTSDSDPGLYALVGMAVPMRQLVARMITRSSNLATNMLVALAEAERVTAMCRTFGADSIEVLRGVEDLAAFEAGMNNTTTARDLGVLLAALARGEVADSAATADMIDILVRQEFNEGIPAGLPPGTRVAHKTGAITRIAHDAAIVYPGADEQSAYVLVVMVRGLDDHAAALSIMRRISRAVFEHQTAG